MKENWCLVNQSLQLNTGWHWMILFVGLMLEIYHCWWPLQERIPPICPWGWSDTNRLLSCSLDCLYFTLEGCLIWTDLSLGVVLYGQIVCFPELWGGLIKTDWPFKDLWDGLVYRNLLFTEPLFRQHYYMYVIRDQLSVIQALFLSSV